MRMKKKNEWKKKKQEVGVEKICEVGGKILGLGKAIKK